MLGITAVDNYWTGIYNAESVVLRATSGLPTEWDNSLLSSHIDGLPDSITDYLVLSAQWAGTTESWEPEVSKGSFGYGVKYTGYQSAIRLHNKETQPVIVNVSFDSQISGVSGWTLPLTGLRAGDSISPTSWTGSTEVTIPKNGYVIVKITSATVNISGCMDSTADNYNPDATQSDGSCEYRGCTDPNSLNYNGLANVDDGSCIEIVSGCTCSSADNYNSSANFDDGSCVVITTTDYLLPLSFSTPQFGEVLRGDKDYLVKCGTGLFTEKGIRTESFNLQGVSAQYMRSNYSGEVAYFKITPRQGFTISGTTNDLAWSATNTAPYVGPLMPTEGPYNDAFVITSVTGPSETPPPATISGCTDSAANNYNSSANSDDGSCTYDSTGGSGGTSETSDPRVVTYSQTSAVAEPITTNLWWPFFALAVFTGGAAWFMRD
jgi:hypothetical protein